MVVDQQSLLEDKDRLEELRRSYDGEARLNESFVVLTVGASLIASLGLVADNNAVIIGAMVVAPWPLPLRVAVRSLDPKLPSYKQVQNIQDTINSRLSGQFPGLELQMQVQRINVSVVEGNEVDLEVDLEQIFNEADTSQAPPQALEDEPNVQAEDSAVAEICSEPDC